MGVNFNLRTKSTPTHTVVTSSLQCCHLPKLTFSTKVKVNV